jgi:hypothetical protein
MDTSREPSRAPVFRLEAAVSPSLQDVDLIRERLGVGYAEARSALEESGGDVVAALALAEDRQQQEACEAGLEHLARELIEEVRRTLSEGQVEGIRVKLGNETVGEVPVALGGVGALLVTLLSLLVGYLRLEVLHGAAQTDRTETS